MLRRSKINSNIIKLMKDKDFSLVDYSEKELNNLQKEANHYSEHGIDEHQEHANRIIKQILHVLDDDKGNGYFTSYVIEMITRILNNKKLDTI